jgi:hypothetical protein
VGELSPPAGNPPEPGAPPAESPRHSGLQNLAVVLVFAAVAGRQLAYVSRYTVNLMYGDQWAIYLPQFKGQGWWASFFFQHGPHREGAGMLLARFLANLSGWNSRWDAFAALSLLIAAAVLAVGLARRFGAARDPLLAAGLPLLFLNVHQYEVFVGPVNLSHGSMPVLLVVACSLAWFIRDPLPRHLVIGTVTVLATFTGFGIFLGVVSPVLVGAEAVQAWRKGKRADAGFALLDLGLIGLGWVVFAHGYKFQPAVDGFRFPYERPAEYLVFVGRMLGNFLGLPVLSGTELVAGLGLAGSLLGIALYHGIRCLRRTVAADPQSAVLFSLAAFTLLFCANCAVGRVFTGATAPLAPRYVTLLIPGMLALYLQLVALAGRRAGYLAALAAISLLVPTTAFLQPFESVGTHWYADGRAAWKAAYLQSGSEAEANRAAGFSIYPVSVEPQLRYLRAHHLNLYLDRPPG